ncbi:GAF and ANTAR domain-containing protein [Streptomyces parvulus]|uniref:GAF and ANTAR domain-containing protein n=1 Tax=Streptomyces parvulus TaxID=146923 RepID=A0ABV5DCC8_9ACTN
MGPDHTHDGAAVLDWLLETQTLEDFLQSLADAALDLSEGVGAGVTLERDRRPLTVVSAGTAASKLDEKQYGQDDGPCLEAARTGDEVLVADMLRENRWGDYPAYAVACEVRSSISLPIAARGHTAGALNLYASPPHAFASIDLGGLRALAAQAAGAIALAQRMADTREFAEQMRMAMESRSVIDQALGVIMGQRECTADEAFAILRSVSQNSNTKLRDLCTRLLTDLTGQAPQPQNLRPRP